jgi:hypothetical protein
MLGRINQNIEMFTLKEESKYDLVQKGFVIGTVFKTVSDGKHAPSPIRLI